MGGILRHWNFVYSLKELVMAENEERVILGKRPERVEE